MFVAELHDYIVANYPSLPVGFVSAEKLQKPYAVLLPVDDDEQAKTFCFSQGEEGEALLQFSGVADGAKSCYGVLYGLKDFIGGLSGDILPSYRIWNNVTEGVKMVQSQSLETWTGLFESTISYTRR